MWTVRYNCLGLFFGKDFHRPYISEYSLSSNPLLSWLSAKQRSTFPAGNQSYPLAELGRPKIELHSDDPDVALWASTLLKVSRRGFVPFCGLLVEEDFFSHHVFEFPSHLIGE